MLSATEVGTGSVKMFPIFKYVRNSSNESRVSQRALMLYYLTT